MNRPFLPLLLALAGCSTGPSLRSFAPAKSPAGVQAELRVGGRNERVRGEVLEVRDSSLILVRDGARVTLIPIRRIYSGKFAKVGYLIGQGEISDGDRRRLRLLSRFPGGMQPDIEARLLAVYGQTELDRAGEP